MRWLLHLILTFTFVFASSANAKPLKSGFKAMIAKTRERIECGGEKVIHDMANIASDLNQGFNSALGFSEQCWTDSSGASIVNCEEVAQADRSGFVSHYDYAPDPLGISPNHRNCTIPEAASILEDLMISDLAKEVEDSLDCQLPFLNDLVDKPATTTIQKFQDDAFAKYEKVLPDLLTLIPKRDRLQHEADFGSGVCRGPAKEGYDPQMTRECKAYRSQAGQAGAAEAKELTRKIELLVNSVPMGVDPTVHEAVLALAKSGVSSKAAFLSEYRKPFKQIRDDSAFIKAQLKKARWKDGNQYYIEPILRAQLLAIPNYKKIIESKEKLSPKVRGILKCLQEKREVGATRAMGLTMGVAAVSAAVTMGASAGVIALGESATAGMIALDLGVTSIGNVQAVDAISKACYGSVQNYEPGKQCTPDQGMAVTVGRADRASCALNVAPILAPVVLAGGSAVGKGLLRTGASDARAASSLARAADEGAVAAKAADVVDETSVIEVIGRRAERRVPPRGRRDSDLANRSGVDGTRGLVERLRPKNARARKMQDLIDAIEQKTFSTDADNTTYIRFANEVDESHGATFFYEDNIDLKGMNEMFKDQNFATAITNLRLHLLNRRLRMAEVHMPDVDAMRNGDYKSLAAAWERSLSPEEIARIKKARELAKQDFEEELVRLNIVRKEDLIAEKFRAGMGRTADEAAAAAKAARELPDTGVRDYRDPEIVAIMDRNLEKVHGTRKAVADRPSLAFLLEQTPDGHTVPTRDAFVIMRKNKTPEQLLAAVKHRYPNSNISLDDARDLVEVNKAVDKFNPQLLNETRKVASLKQAKYGGASGDFCGMGAANTHATACSIASATNRDKALTAARQGEQKVTGEFKKKFARWKKIMGAADCSGDDCVSMAQGRPWTRQEKQDRLNKLNNDPLTRDMRIGFASERVVDPNDIDKITYHAESIEQKLRARLAAAGFPFKRSQDITFAVDMDATAAGNGAAAWLAGVQGKALTANETTAIDKAFSEAVKDVNDHLTSEGLVGNYRPGK